MAPDSARTGDPDGIRTPPRAGLLARLRARPGGRLLVRIGITLAGLVVIALGLLLVPLPGPGWVIVFGGLAIWSLEYRWAARLRRFAVAKVTAWTAWLRRQSWPVRILVTLALAVVVVVVIGGSLVISLGVDTLDPILPG